MNDDEPQKVTIESAEVVGTDPLELELQVRVEKLEEAEASDQKTTRQIMLNLVHLEEASLKHSVALGLLIAVLLFIASRALGA